MSVNENTRNPVSSNQEYFYFLDKYYQDKNPLNVGLSITIKGSLDIADFVTAIKLLSKKHEQLFSTFHSDENGIYRKMHHSYEQPVKLLDLQKEDEVSIDEAIRELEYSEINYSFNLEVLPLLRITLVKISPEEFIFIIINHHITGDGTSLFKNFFEQLSEIYTDLNTGKAKEEFSFRPYSSYIKHQEYGQSDRLFRRCIKYWEKELTISTSEIKLPVFTYKENKHKLAAQSTSSKLTDELNKKLLDYSLTNQITVQSVLLAILYLTLHKWTNKKNLLVGTTFSNRDVLYEDTFGPLVNTLPVVQRINPKMSFIELVDNTQSKLFKGMAFGTMPLEKIFKELNPTKSDGLNFYQVIFNYLPFKSPVFAIDNCEISFKKLLPEQAWINLVFEVERSSDSFEITIDFDSNLYSEKIINEFLASYIEILSNCLDTPLVEVAKIDFLQKNNQIEIIKQGIGPAVDLPKNIQSIHQWFELSLDKFAGPKSIKSSVGERSYQEVEQLSNKLANTLINKEISVGCNVGIYLSRSIEYVISVIGVLKAGATYIPLDISYPIKRIELIINDAKISYLITSEDLQKNLDDKQFINSQFIDICQVMASDESSNRPSFHYQDNPAYITYTSGSTGVPKGVVISHKNVINYIQSMAHLFPLRSTKTYAWLAITSISFDPSIMEIMHSLINNLKLVILSEDEEKTIAISDVILKESITHLTCTPSRLKMILAERNGKAAIASLEYLFVGGEAFPPMLANQLLDIMNGRLFNAYGPTECTIDCCYYEIKSKLSNKVPIGFPIPNSRVLILNSAKQIVPIGVAGELYVGGNSISTGYLNNSSLNKEQFKSIRTLGTYYCSGDQVRYNEIGEIEYIGRIDNQVKIRGYRIELGEIENSINQIDGVAASAVIIHNNDDKSTKTNNDLIIAYIEHEKSVSMSLIKDELSKKLPAYMIPNIFNSLEHMPLNSNGKVDYSSLPKPTFATENIVLEQPRNDTELRIMKCWESVLSATTIGIYQNFFELGGHSLLSLELSILLSREFQIDVQPVEVFKNPTIAQQAVLICEFSDVSKSSLIYLREGGEQPPIYCICGIHLYQDLANYFSYDQTFIGMYIDEEQEYLTNPDSSLTIQEVAQKYFEKISKTHPVNIPLRFIGFCYGGIVAYEISKIAIIQGYQVDKLVLLDSIIWANLSRNNIQRLIGVSKKLVTHGPMYLLSKIKKNIQNRSDRTTTSKDINKFVNNILDMKLINYKPSGQINSDVVLITSNNADLFNTWNIKDNLGWQNTFTGNIIDLSIQGGHTDLLKPPLIKPLTRSLESILKD